MSQQTTLKVVVDRFERFVDELPDARALAGCPDEQLRALWAGLGYYRRARDLRRGAELIATERGGRLPRDLAGWRAIPGCGPYTAAILASVCSDEPVPAVDGNAIRVASRLAALDRDVWSARGQRRVRDLLGELVRLTDSPGDLNQAVMELGFAICRKASPRCGDCPIADHCLALERGVVDRCPPPRPRRAMVDTELVVVVLRNTPDRTVALGRRAGAFLAKTVGFPLLDVGLGATTRTIDSLERLPGANAAREDRAFRHSITHHRISASVLAVEIGRAGSKRVNAPLWRALGVSSPSWHREVEVVARLSSSLDRKAWHTLRQEGAR